MKFKKLEKSEIEQLINELKAKQELSCLVCGSELRNSKRSDVAGICKFKGCKKVKFYWHDTIFKHNKIKIEKILEILELWMQKASVNIIEYVTGVSRISVWKLLQNISKVLIEKYDALCNKIGGKDIIVELDESKFGKRKYNRGHSVDGIWILGMVERTEKRRIVLIPVTNRSAQTLSANIIRNVDSQSTIYSDCWKGYKNIIADFADHLQVNHTQHFKDPSTGVHTNTIEGNWAGIKLHVPNRCKTLTKIRLYLARFMLLRNEETHPLISLINFIL
jgi:ISXO2-like transposase domain